MLTALSLSLFSLLTISHAHPGQTDREKRQEALVRRTYLASLENTDLAHCAPKLAARGVVERSIVRRQETLATLRKRNGITIEKRQDSATKGGASKDQYGFKQTLEKDHKSNLILGADWQQQGVQWSMLGQNQSVVLHPETTEGPYYVSGEEIRRDVREKEAGVTVHLDLQVIDMKTCLPIVNSALEIWGCNATGVYSGVAGGMMGPMANGAVDTDSQARNLQNKALRGIQITDKDGSVQFDTIFPGHYTGRTNHIHVMTHRNQTVLANNTITNGTVTHVGQLFFDQSLIEAVTNTSAYRSNTNQQMLNKQDMIMATGTLGMADNVVNYVLLGDKVEDGIFAWMNFGIDGSSARHAKAAVECSEGGCKTRPFDIWKELGDLLSGKGKGFGPPPMPKMPEGGIPGLEMPSMMDMFGGKGPKGPKGPKGKDGGLMDLLGALLGGFGGKGPGGPPPGFGGLAILQT